MTTTAPTSAMFAGCIAGLEKLANSHPEAAGRFALELSAWIDAVQHDADDWAERLQDEP